MVQGSKFVVNLDGIKLSRRVEKEIEAEIQGVVVKNLAKAGVRTDFAVTKFPKEWLGYWLRDTRLIRDINAKNLAKEFSTGPVAK